MENIKDSPISKLLYSNNSFFFLKVTPRIFRASKMELKASWVTLRNNAASVHEEDLVVASNQEKKIGIRKI